MKATNGGANQYGAKPTALSEKQKTNKFDGLNKSLKKVNNRFRELDGQMSFNEKEA